MGPEPTQVLERVQGLGRRRGRGLERGQGRGLVRAQGPRQERTLLRHDGKGLVRGLVSGLKRGPGQRQGQCLVPALVSGPERRQDQRPLRGQGLPQLSGGRENGVAGEVRSQKLDASRTFRVRLGRQRNPSLHRMLRHGAVLPTSLAPKLLAQFQQFLYFCRFTE
jgi:hypothetical protein